MIKYFIAVIFIGGIIVCSSCNQANDDAKSTAPQLPNYSKLPQFNADSCYSYVAKQCSFGPRVPNTKGHQQCSSYLINFFKKYADTVYVQSTEVKAFTGEMLKIKNIIVVFQPNLSNRLLIAAHWDTRPFADQEKELAKMKQPILAADDAGSGVAVIMELAKILKQKPPTRGVDLVLLDAEDYGCPNPGSPLLKGEYNEDSYCLGTQYWCNNPHVRNYTASEGILLDMVGAKGATFTLEGISMKYAPSLMNGIWQTASNLGYSNFFVYQQANGITDDHSYINNILKIPTIDIIYHDLMGGERWFAPHWHTLNDNMSVIDTTTLKAVGQTLVTHIYKDEL